MDQWTVADPTALIPGVGQLRGNAHVGGDSTNRLIDISGFVSAEIECLAGLFLSVIEEHEHRPYTVTDVEVALGLLSISKNVEMGRVFQKSAIEIEEVAVRVSLTQDRHCPPGKQFLAQAI